LEKSPVLVIGAGSWGTALALVLARNGNRTHLWDYDQDHIQKLIDQSCNNRYLPGHDFPELLHPESDLEPLLEQIEDVVVVVPCEGLHSIFGKMQAITAHGFRICLASKGLDPRTHSLGHDIARTYLGNVRTAVLSGPSFAAEVASGIPTAVAIVSDNVDTARYFSDRFHNDFFRIYTHEDMVGVQVGGAVKNVMAIAAGIADGLGFGANTRAALITRGLAEITRLGIAMGGRQETFMGLAGLGDLVLTCTDDQSRNRRLGLALARGSSLEQAQKEIGQAIEGVRTASAVYDLARELDIEMPISEQIYRVVHDQVDPREAVQSLLAREPKAELK